MAESVHNGDLFVTGNLRVGEGFDPPSGSVTNASMAPSAAIARSKLGQDTLQPFPVNLTDFRVWDAFHTNLPGTPANDDLGLVGGTFATASPSLETEDLKAAGATNKYARCIVRIPAEYDDGQSIQIRARAGMFTTIADTSATVDFEIYKMDEDAGIGSDLVTTAAQSINSLTDANFDFTITESGLISGNLLDVRITVAVNDGATGSAVQARVGAVKLLCDVRG